MFEELFSATAQLIALGGPVVAILVGLSVIALALILLKIFQFWYLRVGSHGRAMQASDLWSVGRPDEAIRRAEKDRSSPSAVLTVIMRLSVGLVTPSHLIEEEASRIAMLRLHSLQSGFRALEAIVQVAPLLGLFGTVLGMIDAFQALQGAGNAVDPSILAGGIWVALLTTAAGLALAMPVSIILTWFESRVERERVVVESLSTKLLFEQQMGTVKAGRAAPQQQVSFAGHVGHAY